MRGFESKIDHDFSNHGSLYCAILKALCYFKATRAHQTSGSHFFLEMFKTRFSRSSKCSKSTWDLLEQPVELTQILATEIIAAHSWYSYVVTIVGYYYAVIIEGFLLIHDGGPYHIETSPFICPENQWTGFCMIATFIMKELVLWNSTSRACYKLIVQLKLAVHQCELFFINDRNMADNTVESHLFCVECKIKSKKIDPKTL